MQPAGALKDVEKEKNTFKESGGRPTARRQWDVAAHTYLVKHGNLKYTMAQFEAALERDVKPSRGMDDDLWWASRLWYVVMML